MFDPLLHQPVRSRLVSLLISNEELTFAVIKKTLELSDGNLSTHISKLEEQEYVQVEKYFEAKRPKTVVKITQKGKQSFKNYIAELQKFIEES